jgi:hypothetical protein
VQFWKEALEAAEQANKHARAVIEATGLVSALLARAGATARASDGCLRAQSGLMRAWRIWPTCGKPWRQPWHRPR